jgi:hypothetical protein
MYYSLEDKTNKHFKNRKQRGIFSVLIYLGQLILVVFALAKSSETRPCVMTSEIQSTQQTPG